MSAPIQTVWLVTREYAGIAEAGGVKNVACSLAEGLIRNGMSVSVFIPVYGCVAQEGTFLFSCEVSLARSVHKISFSSVMIHGVKIILVDSDIYREKQAVYVYTEIEAQTIPGAVRGKGHFDVDIMNMLLQKSVMEYAVIAGTVPDILHCQDAHTAILPALIANDPICKSLFSHTACVVTIHNAGPGYRQSIPGISRAAYFTGLDSSVLEKALLNGNVEPFLLAAENSTLTTVSPWYADELTNHEYDQFTEGLSGEMERRGITVTGITNGIDYGRYDPRDVSCSLLPALFDPVVGDLAGKYSSRTVFFDRIKTLDAVPDLTRFGTITQDPHAVYFSYHGRIAWQKGLDVLEKTIHFVLDQMNEARFIILGQGDAILETLFVRLAQRYAGRLVYIRGYDRSLARMAVAVSDFIVLPSVFEPCGLEDFIAQIYGTLPVAHAVGGLQKIEDCKNGFLYRSERETNDSVVLARLLLELAKPVVASDGEGCACVPQYAEMIRYAAAHVRNICNWDSIITDQYIPLYERIHAAKT